MAEKRKMALSSQHVDPHQSRNMVREFLNTGDAFVMVALTENEAGEPGIELYSDLTAANVAVLLTKAVQCVKASIAVPTTDE